MEKLPPRIQNMYSLYTINLKEVIFYEEESYFRRL